MSRRKQSNAPCHCAVCTDGYSRVTSITSPGLSRAVSLGADPCCIERHLAGAPSSLTIASVSQGAASGTPGRRSSLAGTGGSLGSGKRSALGSLHGPGSIHGSGSQGAPGTPGGLGGYGGPEGGPPVGYGGSGGSDGGGGCGGSGGPGSPGGQGGGGGQGSRRGSGGAPGSGGGQARGGEDYGGYGAARGQGGPGGRGGFSNREGHGGDSFREGRDIGTGKICRPGGGVGRRSPLADRMILSGTEDECEAEDRVLDECIPDLTEELERDDSDLHKVKGQNAPYLPQPEDDESPQRAAPMEAVGPWAQGRPDWGPLGGLTGTRPVVDRFSITRFSVPEWRKRNLDLFQRASGDNHQAGMVDFNARACMQHVAAEADKHSADSTARLEQRAQDVHRWQSEVAKAHQTLWEEIQLLETFRPRLRRVLCAVTKTANVVGLCLDLRCKRNEPDLVRDEVEEELIKEVSLVKEVRGLMKRCLDQVNEQQAINKAGKQRLSHDWSDKKEAYEKDSVSCGLRIGGSTAMFREGATRFPDSQSTPENWEARSRENICHAENERAKSYMLRNLVESMIEDCARDLRMQAAKVDEAFQRRIQVVTSLLRELENNLALIVQRIVETEQLICELKAQLRNLDMVLKVAQTRLDKRIDRPRVENCRDCPQFGLVDEVKCLSEQCSAILGQIKQAEIALQDLNNTRQEIEREIVNKQKQLYLDRDRAQKLRQHYPPAAALTGR